LLIVLNHVSMRSVQSKAMETSHGNYSPAMRATKR
jgi:hypothetical protein